MTVKKAGSVPEKSSIGSVSEKIPKFTKQQLLQSRLYQPYRDLLAATLKADHSYTKQEVEEQIRLFQKGTVN